MKSFLHSFFISVFLTYFLLSISYAQQKITDSMFSQWLESSADFVVFDIRVSETPDSIIYPCFYTEDVDLWIDSIRGLRRVLIVAGQEDDAGVIASSLAEDGYPADSLFYCGVSEITAQKRPLSDTIPLGFLSTSFQIQEPLSAGELYALRLSRRGIQIIDVRTVSEIEDGMIPDVCNIVWPDEFTGSMSKLNPDVLTIVYCRSGNRASQAISYLIDSGFSEDKLINFGGFSKWSEYAEFIVYIPADDCQCLGIDGYIAGRQPQKNNEKEGGAIFNRTIYLKRGYNARDLMGRAIPVGPGLKRETGISSKVYLFYRIDKSGKKTVRKELLSK